MVHSFLLIGQSNMAGRGFLNEAEPLDTCNKRLKVLRNGRWQTMYRPVNPDRPFSGTCLAESFAKAYADAHPDVEVGVIPCADGGTSLEKWQPGGLLFDNAVHCAKLAMRTSQLVGILWHQGEADCADDRYPLYVERFQKIMDAIRQELNCPDIPFLLGGLGDFLANCTLSNHLINYPHINTALQQIARDNPHTAFVPAIGLGANPDNLHFNAQALKEFGLRYYEEFQKICGESESIADKRAEHDNIRTEMELL